MRNILALSILAISFCLTATQTFAASSSYNVYTPKTYKQIDIVQSPKYSRIYGEGIELLVDFSGSMFTWIKIAKESLVYILPKIPDTASVALRVFGERNFTDYYTFNTACKSTRLVSYFKSGNQSKILKGFNEAALGGMTPLEFALREAVEKDFKNMTVVSRGNPNGKRKKIILLTDGSDTCGGDPCAYIREAISKHKDLQIDVIQVGEDTSLRCLTETTGGNYYQINNDNKKFEEAFETSFNVPKGTIEEGKRNDPERRRKEEKRKPRTQEDTQPPVQTEQQQQQQPTRGYKFIKF